MKVIIQNNNENEKCSQFISIITLLKNLVSFIKIDFYEEHAYFQGLDKSHVCLYEIKLHKNLFNSYEPNEDKNETVCIDINILSSVMSIYQSNQLIILSLNESENENLNIEFINETGKNTSSLNSINKSFEIPLIDIEVDNLDISEIKYNIIFSIKSKIIYDLINQLTMFGEDLEVSCDEENITFISSSADKGKMKSSVCFNDLDDFDIDIEEEKNLTFSLAYVKKLLSIKITNNVKIYLIEEKPMKINYNLGDNSYANFYLAPKFKDE